jgi:hypothetical protein
VRGVEIVVDVAVVRRVGVRADRDGEFTSRSTLGEGAQAWLAMFKAQVERGTRSASTLDLYQHASRTSWAMPGCR